MGKSAFILMSLALLLALCARGDQNSLDGLLGKQTSQRRGAFNDALNSFNNSTNPNSANNIYQSPQQAFLSNIMQSSQNMKLPERKDPSEITKQFEEGRKQAEESFKGLNENLQKGLTDSAKLDALTEVLTSNSESSATQDSEIISSLSALIADGRSIGTGTSASASAATYIDMLNASTQTRIQELLILAQAQTQTAATQAQVQAPVQVGQDFLLGIEEVGASMASRGGSSPFAAAAALRVERDVAGASNSFTPNSVDEFNRTPADPHFGH